VIISNANSEISYNRCTNYMRSGGDYGADGGFLEVDPRTYGQPVTNLKIHHNYSYGNEGFLEIEGSESRNGGITVAWCALKSHRRLVGESPIVITARRSRSRRPVHPGDWLC